MPTIVEFSRAPTPGCRSGAMDRSSGRKRRSLQFLQSVDVPHGAVVDDPVSGSGIDRIADVVADRRSVLLQPEVIADVDIAICSMSTGQAFCPPIRPSFLPCCSMTFWMSGRPGSHCAVSARPTSTFSGWIENQPSSY